MKNICAITMVRNDDRFLRKWIGYYGRQLGEENLYVFLDGEDQTVPEWKGSAHIKVVPRIRGNVVEGDKGRIAFLSAQATELLKRYDLVIGTDVDEFLAVDPAVGKTLPEYLSSIEINPSVSGLGLDIGEHLEYDKAIDWDKPLLEQRRHAYLSSRYTKTSVISRPVAWGAGFHRVRRHNFRIDPNLYLLHFGCVDLNRLRERSGDSDLVDNGWSHHLSKRARTITYVTKIKPCDFKKWTRVARVVQRFIRPIYAWNKPAMLGLKRVVRLPEHFRKII